MAIELIDTVLRAPMWYIYHLADTILKNLGLNQPRNETMQQHTTHDISADITAPSSLTHVHPIRIRLEHEAPDEVAPPLIDEENNNYINRRPMPMGNPSLPPSTCHGNDTRRLDPPSTMIGSTGIDNKPLPPPLIWHGRIKTNIQDPCIGRLHIPCHVCHHATNYS